MTRQLNRIEVLLREIEKFSEIHSPKRSNNEVDAGKKFREVTLRPHRLNAAEGVRRIPGPMRRLA